MNKKITGLILFAGLFCLASLAFGQSGPSIPNTGPASFSALLQGLASAVAELVGGVCTIMVIISGILWVTSAGSTERTGMAKKTLMYAIIGTVIGLAASAIIAEVSRIVHP